MLHPVLFLRKQILMYALFKSNQSKTTSSFIFRYLIMTTEINSFSLRVTMKFSHVTGGMHFLQICKLAVISLEQLSVQVDMGRLERSSQSGSDGS